MTDCHPSRLETGFDTVSAIATPFPADPKGCRCIDLICQEVGAQVGCVFTFGQDRSKFQTHTVWHRGEFVPIELAYSAKGQGPFARMLREHEPLAVGAARGRRLIKALQEHLGLRISALTLVPLAWGNSVSGAVLCGRTDRANAFTTEDIAVISALARVASLAAHYQAMQAEAEALQQKVVQLNAQLLQSAKLAATGKLAASIAHEINNPLQSVQSCIYLVNDGVPPDGPSRQYLDIAREELDRIAKIVQRLADFYRPSQDSLRPTELNALLDTVLVLMGKRLQQGKVRVTKSLASELPLVAMSADQMKQVFVNLVLNALEAMPDGGELHVTTRAVRKPHSISVEIGFRDSGTGISPDGLDRIFDPFYSTKAKGTGLGLSISHDIVERHAGSIRVESSAGRGSVFTVSLPVAGAGMRERHA
jgi:signal transduction histidine kinase